MGDPDGEDIMNYMTFVSWGVFGGTTAQIRANRYASWGMWEASVFTEIVSALRDLFPQKWMFWKFIWN
jgi:hypothetical protein